MAKKEQRYRVLVLGGLGNGQIAQASIVTAKQLREAFDMSGADVEKLVASKDLETVDDSPIVEPAPEPAPAERAVNKDEKK